MSKQSPIVTLGLPVFNGSKYLERALSCILNQTFSDFELIISDNASSDETELICRRFAALDSRIIYNRNSENIGLAANHNLLVHSSRGKYFKWAAHDDECAPIMLQRFVDALDAAPPSVVMVFSKYELIDELGSPIGLISDGVASSSRHSWGRLARFIMNVSIYNCTSGLIRADILKRTGLHGLYPTSDRVLFAELAMLGEFVEICEPLVKYRIHTGSSFRAHSTHQARRELFNPAMIGRRSILTHEGRLHLELLRRALLTRQDFGDRLMCLGVAAVIPPWQRFRNFGGRWKERIRSSVRKPLRLG
jgi:glycosyltransferase involved in cell wall biosynthesis